MYPIIRGLIFLSLFFVFFTYAEKKEKCLKIGSYDVIFYEAEERNGFYVLELVSRPKMKLGVYCNKVNQVILCYGDDDAGAFKLSSSGLVLRSSLTFSETSLKFVEIGQKGQKVDFVKCSE